MNRRNVIKALGLSAAGLATVPLWVDAWTVEKLPGVDLDITKSQLSRLTGLIDAMIPATDTPGAKELGVEEFIIRIVDSCYEAQVQDEFLAGFDELDRVANEQYGKSFMKLTDVQKTEILSQLEAVPVAPEKKINFVSFVKGLTITGYMSSEYVLTHVLDYKLIPSHFYGSFPVDKSIYSNV